jgi:hypothetical protein
MAKGERRLIARGVSTAVLTLSSVLALCAEPSGSPRGQQLVALYTFAGNRSMSGSVGKMPENLPAFAKFCGYNTLEFCDSEFEYPQSSVENYFQSAKAIVASAHREHLKAYIILLTNESRRLNLQKPSENEYMVLFNPVTDPGEYQQRLEDVRQAIEKGFAAADGFEVFAGDPGGCVGKGCDIEQYVRFAQAYAQMVRKLGSGAELTLNTWAIANWGATLGVGLDFWNAETDFSKKIIGSDISFADAVTLPGHNLYRFLVRQLYNQAGRPVPEWPDRAAIEAIHAKAKRAYLWPHFIVDDDPGRPMTFDRVHFEVRYLKELAEKIRALGVDGAFVNAYNPAVQMGNIYAYGQLNRNPDKSVEVILNDFAALIARPGSANRLGEVFAFMENHSWWASQMPPQYRLKSLSCQIKTYDEALAALKGVVPLTRSSVPLLISPKEYLAKVQSTLVFMREHYHD